MKLNIGCGNKKKPGFVGVDASPCAAAELLADISCKLPFQSDSVDEVWMDNVIEHIGDIPRLMAELARVCKSGATVTVLTPHFASAASWRDPTHVHHLSFFSMDHFEKKLSAHYMGATFQVCQRKLSFSGIMGNIGRLLHRLSPRKYEAYWCFIFRPGSLTFVLRTVPGLAQAPERSQGQS